MRRGSGIAMREMALVGRNARCFLSRCIISGGQSPTMLDGPVRGRSWRLSGMCAWRQGVARQWPGRRRGECCREEDVEISDLHERVQCGLGSMGRRRNRYRVSSMVTIAPLVSASWHLLRTCTSRGITEPGVWSWSRTRITLGRVRALSASRSAKSRSHVIIRRPSRPAFSRMSGSDRR